ncbi:MAG: hypothetical protein D6791_00105 [Chloroflexi bacterium]|nr:MAG: hypothetical protein D6791_00105 [Chloroflexota bacterium]
MKHSPRMMIDFSAYIADRVRDFTGRKWVFQAVNDWLAWPGGPRFFVLTGEPGSGKTAIASRLVQFSQGTDPPANGLPHLSPHFLSAVHFCSARDRRWINPHIFAESLALQLAARYPAYAEALVEKSGTRQIRIEVEQHVQQVEGGQVAGVVIKQLDVGDIPPEDAFIRVVREPLEALFNQGIVEQVIVLVDGLDEALRYGRDVNIVSLLSEAEFLPAGVRFILTSRPEIAVLRPLRRLNPEEHSLTTNDGLVRSREDVKQHVLHTLVAHPTLTDRLSAGLSPEDFATAVRDKSDGNFLYVRHLLEMLATQAHEITWESLDELPVGLDGIYIEFLERLVAGDEETWETRYAPVLGTLAVAQEALTEEQLAGFIEVKKSGVRTALKALRQLLDVDESLPASQRAYTLYHRSFADFLLDADRAEEYWCEAAEAHQRIASCFLERQAGHWDAWDEYGVRYTATHLAEAAKERDQPEQHELTADLVTLVLDPGFQQTHQRKVGDLAALQDDLKLALRRVAVDHNPAALPLVVRTALALVQFRRAQLRPEPIFELARAGNVEAAEGRLDLFSVEPHWRRAAALTVAWLAAEQDPEEARALRDRIAGEPLSPWPLSLLLDRVDATLNNTPPPLPPPLPDPPPPEVAQSIVARMGGLKAESGLVMEFVSGIRVQPSEMLVEALEILGDAAPAFVAEQDGPLLVAFAVAEPEQGDDYFQQYLNIHAANNYVYYRNLSLWLLLDAVLRHPDQVWTRDTATRLITTALTGAGLAFQEGLPFAVLASQTLAGQASAREALDERRQQALADAAALDDARGRSDSWGAHKRRLAALAEAYSILPDSAHEVSELVGLARSIPRGFAGYLAPAWLTLAETIQVCRHGNWPAIDHALSEARQSAHNIQDTIFCARTTARVNAMQRRWWHWPANGFSIADAAARLSQDASTPEFAALHLVGEAYERREWGPDKLELSPTLRNANTLKMLAEAYQQPLSEFQRLNRDHAWTPDDLLPDGAEVNVPDPEFAPLLAARFAAEALADSTMAGDERVALIQSLVPVAASNPTALDAVLSRLLLAARPADTEALDALADAVHQ